jgi:single-strand DNA-binding protein
MNINNTVTLIGNVGATPELKKSNDGKSWCSFDLAINSSYVNEKGDIISNPTDWFRLSAFDKTAHNICKYVKVGDKIIVSGKLTTYLKEIHGSHYNLCSVIIKEFQLILTSTVNNKKQ